MKKFFFILITLISVLHAEEYYFYVQSPEEVDSYINIFNGIASIFGSEDYLGLLRLVFLFGGFFVFVTGVFRVLGAASDGQDLLGIKSKGGISEYYGYLILGTALLTIIFGKSATVIVKTNNLPTYCTNNNSEVVGAPVDNVPEIVAYSFSFLNRVSKELTFLTESAFIPPNNTYGDTSLTHNEGYIGALKQSMSLLGLDLSKSLNKDTQEDLPKAIKTIFSQCILIPFSGKGLDGLDEITKLKSSNNLRSYLDKLYTDDPLIGDIHAREYQCTFQGETWKCGDLWDNITDKYLTDYSNNLACSYPNINAGAVQLITGEVNASKSTMTNLAIQSGLIAELEQTVSHLGIDTPGMKYGIAKSKAEFVQTKLAEGAFEAEFLPILQATLRAILYGMFPFIFVIVLLPGGLTVLGSYVRSVLWIELWTPTAAIINMFIMQHAENRFGSIYNTNGVTYTNAVDLLSTGSTLAGAAAYLYASVPALTWLFLTGSALMFSNIGNTMARNVAKNISTESINRDVQEIQKMKEMRKKTGEEFSLAETQHFEAVKTGAVEGSTLAVEKNKGIKSSTNSASFSKAKELAHAKSSIKRLGGTAETAGKKTGFSNAFEETTRTKGNERLSGENGENTGLGDVVQKDKVMSAYAEQNAINHNSYDQQMHDDAAQTQRTQIRENAELLRAQVMTHKKIYNQLRSAGYSKDEAAAMVMNRFRQSNAWINSSNHNVAEQMLLKKMGLKGWTNNGKGEHNIKQWNANNLNKFNNREAESEWWNLQKKLGNSETLSANGFSGYEVGTYDAIRTIEQIAQQRANIAKLREEFSEIYGEDAVKQMSDIDIVTRDKAANVTYLDQNGDLIQILGESKTINAASVTYKDFARANILNMENGTSIMKNIDLFNDYMSMFGFMSMLGMTGFNYHGGSRKPTSKMKKERKIKIKTQKIKEREQFIKDKYNKKKLKYEKEILESIDDYTLRRLGITRKQLLSMTEEEFDKLVEKHPDLLNEHTVIRKNLTKLNKLKKNLNTDLTKITKKINKLTEEGKIENKLNALNTKGTTSEKDLQKFLKKLNISEAELKKMSLKELEDLIAKRETELVIERNAKLNTFKGLNENLNKLTKDFEEFNSNRNLLYNKNKILKKEITALEEEFKKVKQNIKDLKDLKNTKTKLNTPNNKVKNRKGGVKVKQNPKKILERKITRLENLQKTLPNKYMGPNTILKSTNVNKRYIELIVKSNQLKNELEQNKKEIQELSRKMKITNRKAKVINTLREQVNTKLSIPQEQLKTLKEDKKLAISYKKNIDKFNDKKIKVYKKKADIYNQDYLDSNKNKIQREITELKEKMQKTIKDKEKDPYFNKEKYEKKINKKIEKLEKRLDILNSDTDYAKRKDYRESLKLHADKNLSAEEKKLKALEQEKQKLLKQKQELMEQDLYTRNRMNVAIEHFEKDLSFKLDKEIITSSNKVKIEEYFQDIEDKLDHRIDKEYDNFKSIKEDYKSGKITFEKYQELTSNFDSMIKEKELINKTKKSMLKFNKKFTTLKNEKFNISREFKTLSKKIDSSKELVTLIRTAKGNLSFDKNEIKKYEKELKENLRQLTNINNESIHVNQMITESLNDYKEFDKLSKDFILHSSKKDILNYIEGLEKALEMEYKNSPNSIDILETQEKVQKIERLENMKKDILGLKDRYDKTIKDRAELSKKQLRISHRLSNKKNEVKAIEDALLDNANIKTKLKKVLSSTLKLDLQKAKDLLTDGTMKEDIKKMAKELVEKSKANGKAMTMKMATSIAKGLVLVYVTEKLEEGTKNSESVYGQVVHETIGGAQEIFEAGFGGFVDSGLYLWNKAHGNDLAANEYLNKLQTEDNLVNLWGDRYDKIADAIKNKSYDLDSLQRDLIDTTEYMLSGHTGGPSEQSLMTGAENTYNFVHGFRKEGDSEFEHMINYLDDITTPNGPTEEEVIKYQENTYNFAHGFRKEEDIAWNQMVSVISSGVDSTTEFISSGMDVVEELITPEGLSEEEYIKLQENTYNKTHGVKEDKPWTKVVETTTEAIQTTSDIVENLITPEGLSEEEYIRLQENTYNKMHGVKEEKYKGLKDVIEGVKNLKNL